MSKQYENDIAKQIHRGTDGHIRAYRCGYSGSNAMPQPDVLVTTGTVNYAMEIKGPIQSGHCYVDEEDLEQLEDCENGYTAAVLVVKFQNREPMVVRYFGDLTNAQSVVKGAKEYEDMSVAERMAALTPNAFDPSVTDSGTLSLTKPDTDDWPSARAGSDDVDAILSGVGVPTDESVEVV